MTLDTEANPSPHAPRRPSDPPPRRRLNTHDNARVTVAVAVLATFAAYGTSVTLLERIAAFGAAVASALDRRTSGYKTARELVDRATFALFAPLAGAAHPEVRVAANAIAVALWGVSVDAVSHDMWWNHGTNCDATRDAMRYAASLLDVVRAGLDECIRAEGIRDLDSPEHIDRLADVTTDPAAGQTGAGGVAAPARTPADAPEKSSDRGHATTSPGRHNAPGAVTRETLVNITTRAARELAALPGDFAAARDMTLAVLGALGGLRAETPAEVVAAMGHELTEVAGVLSGAVYDERDRGALAFRGRCDAAVMMLLVAADAIRAASLLAAAAPNDDLDAVTWPPAGAP